MQRIQSISELESHYDAVLPSALAKVTPRLTPLYVEWINASRFVVLSTVGPTGTDTSPRGDIGPVVRIADDRTILMPDWRGNNRLDSLRNIVADGRASLMFMVPGSNNVVRVNGNAIVTVDSELVRSFERGGKSPKTVIVITVQDGLFPMREGVNEVGPLGRSRPKPERANSRSVYQGTAIRVRCAGL